MKNFSYFLFLFFSFYIQSAWLLGNLNKFKSFAVSKSEKCEEKKKHIEFDRKNLLWWELRIKASTSSFLPSGTIFFRKIWRNSKKLFRLSRPMKNNMKKVWFFYLICFEIWSFHLLFSFSGNHSFHLNFSLRKHPFLWPSDIFTKSFLIFWLEIKWILHDSHDTKVVWPHFQEHLR